MLEVESRFRCVLTTRRWLDGLPRRYEDEARARCSPCGRDGLEEVTFW